METWSVEQVCSWLVEKNLGELVHRFQGRSKWGRSSCT
ncbi:SAMD3 isoform 11 [Pan troglodytes]|uniref:Sterile alpha motif domain containing 3 n=3 Tax=Hominidae TaxID=9604 RepID=E9PPN0_HUMAN|nr:SAMD3 isoform 11 [Pan troglodytes]PNJ78507.1 SAMD3 isoform 11 [Pongo abelii]